MLKRGPEMVEARAKSCSVTGDDDWPSRLGLVGMSTLS